MLHSYLYKERTRVPGNCAKWFDPCELAEYTFSVTSDKEQSRTGESGAAVDAHLHRRQTLGV